MSQGPKIEDDHGGVRLTFWAMSTDAGYEQTFIDGLAAGDLSKLAGIVAEGLQWLTGHTVEVDGVAASTHEADQAREIAGLKAERLKDLQMADMNGRAAQEALRERDAMQRQRDDAAEESVQARLEVRAARARCADLEAERDRLEEEIEAMRVALRGREAEALATAAELDEAMAELRAMRKIAALAAPCLGSRGEA